MWWKAFCSTSPPPPSSQICTAHEVHNILMIPKIKGTSHHSPAHWVAVCSQIVYLQLNKIDVSLMFFDIRSCTCILIGISLYVTGSEGQWKLLLTAQHTG